MEPAESSRGADAPGRLVLMPNALDLGTGQAIDLRLVMSSGAIQRAAGLTHWVVENGKSARAFLKRVHAVAPLVKPVQEMAIAELPRAAKGRAGTGPREADWRRLLEPALAGHDIGLLSEAGLPAVADPGSELVAQAHSLGLPVEPWPGPSSLMMALSASGLGGQSFAFVGYLPIEPAARAKRIVECEQQSRRAAQTQIAIETPYRNSALMQALVQTLSPQTRLAVACALTLPNGWCRTQTVASWRNVHPKFGTDLPAVFGWLAA